MVKHPERDDVESPLDELARALDDALTLCGNCGRQVSPAEVRCPGCGATLPEAADAGESAAGAGGPELWETDVAPEVSESADRTEVELDSFIREVSKELEIERPREEPEEVRSGAPTARATSKVGAVAFGLTLVGVLVYVVAFVGVLPVLGNGYAALTIVVASILIVYGSFVRRTGTAAASAVNSTRSPSVKTEGITAAVPEGAPRRRRAREEAETASSPRPIRKPERGSEPTAARCPLCDGELSEDLELCPSCGARLID